MSETNGSKPPEPPAEGRPLSPTESYMRQHLGVIMCGMNATNPLVPAPVLVEEAARAMGFALAALLITTPEDRGKLYQAMRRGFRDGMDEAPRLEPLVAPATADTAVKA
jgi:hypothetical protein